MIIALPGNSDQSVEIKIIVVAMFTHQLAASGRHTVSSRTASSLSIIVVAAPRRVTSRREPAAFIIRSSAAAAAAVPLVFRPGDQQQRMARDCRPTGVVSELSQHDALYSPSSPLQRAYIHTPTIDESTPDWSPGQHYYSVLDIMPVLENCADWNKKRSCDWWDERRMSSSMTHL